MENDQNPFQVHTNSCTMEIDQSQLAADKGPSPLERYGHEGPSTVLFDLSPLKSVRPEHEGSSSYFEGLPDESPDIRTFFDDVNTFGPCEPFQIQSDTAHQQVNEIIPERREEKKTKKSQEWERLYEQSQKWKLDEEVVKQISKNVINLPGAGFDPNGENNDRE